MRKALIGILLAASASLPAAAWAAPDDSEVRTPRQERTVQRAQRVEQRQQRQEVRQQARQDVGRPRIQQPDRRQDTGQSAGTQGRGGWSGRGGDQSGRGWSRDRTPNSSGSGQWQGSQNDPRSERYRRPDGQVGTQHNWDRDRRGDNRGGGWNRDDDRRRGDWNRDDDRRRGDWNRDNDRRRDWNGHRRWDRNGWRNDRRYNWQGWRNSNRHLYRNPGYYAPYRHYRYSRLSIGIVLDRLFWGQNYWIGDPWQYRLPDPGPGFTWVRYYNDVLLIDTYSGEVVDVIYDFFW